MATASSIPLSDLRIFGRPLLSMNEASALWNEGPLLDLKSNVDDVFWSAYGSSLSSEGTLQTEALRHSYYHGGGIDDPPSGPWAACRICKVIYDAVSFCGNCFIYRPTRETFHQHIADFAAFFLSSSLIDILLEGWGFAFASAAIYCYEAAHSLGHGGALYDRFDDGSEGARAHYAQLFSAAVQEAWPQETDHQGNYAVNFELILEYLHEGERFMKQQLQAWEWPTWHWWLWAADFWLYRLLELSKAWNSGGATPEIAHDRYTGAAMYGRDYSLRSVSRAVRKGWAASVVAAEVSAPEGPKRHSLEGIAEVELLVVVHRLDDHERVSRWSAATRAFKTVLPSTVLSSLRAAAHWSDCRGDDAATSYKRCSVACRIRAQRSIYSGCRKTHSAGDCEGHPSEYVSSLRIGCAVPWSLPLAIGTKTSVVLGLQGSSSYGPNVHVPFDIVSAEASTPSSLAVCVMPIFGYSSIEERWGDLVGSWLWYHLEVLRGIDSIYIYDVDGSLQPSRRSAAMRGSPWPSAVHYQADFPSQVYAGGLRNLSRTWQCPYCVENIAYDHCLFHARQRADSVLVLHGLDEWLVPAPGSGLDLAKYVGGLHPRNAVVFLRQNNLHHRGHVRGKDLIGSGVFASPVNLTSSSWEGRIFPNLVVMTSGRPSYIDTHVAVYMPRQAVESKGITWERGPRAIRGWWVNHYVDFMDERFWDPEAKLYFSNERQPAREFVEDRSFAEYFSRVRAASKAGSAVKA